MKSSIPQLFEAFEVAIKALKKINDPLQRTEKDPEAYIQLGYIMHIAKEALQGIDRVLEGRKNDNL